MKHELTTPDPNRVPLYHVDLTTTDLEGAGWSTMPIAHVKVRQPDGKVAEVQFRIGLERGKTVWRVEDFNRETAGSTRITAGVCKPAQKP